MPTLSEKTQLHEVVSGLAKSLIDVAHSIDLDTLPNDPRVSRAEFDQRATRQHVNIAAGYLTALMTVLDMEHTTYYVERAEVDINNRVVVSWFGKRFVLPTTVLLEAKRDEIVAKLKEALQERDRLKAQVEGGNDLWPADLGLSQNALDELATAMGVVNAPQSSWTWKRLLDSVRTQQRMLRETRDVLQAVAEAIGAPVGSGHEKLATRVQGVVADRDRYKANHDNACHQIAQMFHAVTGKPWGDGPTRGVLEDVTDAVGALRETITELSTRLSHVRQRASSDAAGTARERNWQDCAARVAQSLMVYADATTPHNYQLMRTALFQMVDVLDGRSADRYRDLDGRLAKLEADNDKISPPAPMQANTCAEAPAYPSETVSTRDQATILTEKFLHYVRSFASDGNTTSDAVNSARNVVGTIARRLLGSAECGRLAAQLVVG